mgnify:CR=1 FL=1
MRSGIMAGVIYKIVTRGQWSAGERTRAFDGAPVGIEDGFIHLSDAGQVRETAQKHFAGQQELLLVAVDAASLGALLVWEPSRGGQLFPHLYGKLHLDSVIWVRELPPGEDGRHLFPAELPS